MKIIFTHVFGRQTNSDISHILVSAEVDPDEEKEALENGWLWDQYSGWYQCRSVRINLSKFTSKKKIPKNLDFKISSLNYFNKETLEKIYKDYVEYKKYSEIHESIIDDVLRKSIFCVVFDNNIPVAFTKFCLYNGGLESQFFCWNYHKPKLSIGSLIQIKEIDYAESLGLDYLYIGQGYEESSIYKANIPDFEWRTGSEWSINKEQYINLCKRDSSLHNIIELNDININV